MKNITIRKATEKDLKVVVELNASLFKEDAGQRDPLANKNWPSQEGIIYFSKRIKDKNSICLVAEVRNEVVGYLAGSVKKVETWRPVKRTELESMYIKNEFRDRGIGTKLVEEFFKWSKGKGVQRALVVAYATNERAIKFYRKMGFISESLSLEAPIFK